MIANQMVNEENGKETRKESRRNGYNHAKVCFDARSENEGFARMVIMAFMTPMDPTLDELEDVKTAVSEAVTNAIIHGYEMNETGMVEMECIRQKDCLSVCVRDRGVGIADIGQARQPLFTTKPELERSGMGFSFMETFMDAVIIESQLGAGTSVKMQKYIGNHQDTDDEGECDQ